MIQIVPNKNIFLHAKKGFPILSNIETVYSKILSLFFYKNFSVGSTTNSVMVGVCGIGIPPRTEKKVKPTNNIAVHDHLLHLNYFPSF